MREFIQKLQERGMVDVVKTPISQNLELGNYLIKNRKATIFKNIKETKHTVVANIFSSRKHIGIGFGCDESEVLTRLVQAIQAKPIEPVILNDAPVYEVKSSLEKIPMPKYFGVDGGPYWTSSIVFAKDPEYGRNMSVHRIMKTPDGRLTIRIVERHLWEFYNRSKRDLEIAICIGVDPFVMMASAICTPSIGIDELGIAGALKGEPIKMVKCKTVDVEVPASAEYVIEGKITPEMADEGPFVDLTRTLDIVRKQPVIKVNGIYHRKDPIFYALLSGGMDHATIWKTPTEAVMFDAVSKVANCTDVLLPYGGCSRLHGIVKVRKSNPWDPEKVGKAAFEAHKSMKRLMIVDDDINIHDPEEVEWALATRFQAKTDQIMWEGRGSTLDPSVDETYITTKMILDCTKKTDKPKFNKIF